MKAALFALSVIMGSQISLAQTQTTVTTQAPAPGLPWTATLKSEVTNTIEAAKDVGGAGTETQFRLAYKFTDAAQLGLLIGGKYNLATEAQVQADQEMLASDFAIAGILVAPGILEADKTEIDGRLYLPTSDASEVAKQNYQLRADVKLPYTLAPQRTATLTVSPRLTDYQVAATRLDLVSQLKLAQGKAIAPYVALNHKLKTANTAGLTRNAEYIGPEVGLDLVPHKLVKVSLSVSQDRNILNPTARKVRAEYSAFDTRETTYLLGAQIKL